MVTTKLNLSMTEPQVRQIYAKQGDTGRVLDIALDQTPEDGTLRILRPDGVEVTSEAVTGGEVSESGETVTFESMTEADVTELTVGIEPVQDLSHGDPSPSNICPISGWSELNVTRTDCEWINKGGYWYAQQTHTTRLALSRLLKVKPNTSYTIHGNGVLRFAVQEYNNKAKSSSSNPVLMDSGWKTTTSYTFTTLSTTNYVWLCQSSPNYSYDITPSDGRSVWINSTDDENYTHAQISLGQTVYGGTLDMVSGALTVTHGNIASYNGETLPSTWISDRDVYASGTTPTTGAQVVYELATPLTYTLTAQQIKTLVGTNNVWASSGDIVSIKFTYGGLLSELPNDATEIVGKCYCDVEQNGVSSMPFTLNVKKNERES